MRNIKIASSLFLLFACLLSATTLICAQSTEVFTLTAEKLKDAQTVDLSKAGWLYRAGDDASWAQKDLDESAWERLESTGIDPNKLPRASWNGRGWFRLRVRIDESVADKTLAVAAKHHGASEIYLDGRLLVRFGRVGDGTSVESRLVEYNPNLLPVLFEFEEAGEHVFAVRYATGETLQDITSGKGWWLARGGLRPGFYFALAETGDIVKTTQSYTNAASMRIGFLFIGIMLALALIHFLLYVFYRAERANLFYSIYAFSNALGLVCGNLLTFGHQNVLTNAFLIILTSIVGAVTFVALLAFLHVAFRRPFGLIFWTIAATWALSFLVGVLFLGNRGWFNLVPSIGIFLTFTFSIYLLVGALREGQPGARILMGGVQLYSFGMLSLLLRQFRVIDMSQYIYVLGEITTILAVPVSVSVFLARNFARTSRDLKEQLVQVKELSLNKIEQEKQSAILRAENERRTKELKEARQLQLSMLPKRVPQFPDLEIAAYMKPATEVGGDYYDFFVGTDGTLTVAVGDATGHGLKAGTVVTATKGLFNNLAHEPDIARIFKQTSSALKRMNLRGLYMAMTMLKIKDNNL